MDSVLGQCRKSLLPALDEFIVENPNDQVSFLLTHAYPLVLEFDNLKGGDRVMYEVLSEKYNVELGLAVNFIDSNYNDGGFIEEECLPLNIMDFRCKLALDDFILGLSKKPLHTPFIYSEAIKLDSR